MQQTMYKWIVLQGGKIVNAGIIDEPIDILVEAIFPEANSTADRSISSLQMYADTNLPTSHYTFKYKEIQVDFSDIEEMD